MQKVPAHIVSTINTLLAPYGKTYGPDAESVKEGSGYLSIRKAAEYTSLSRSAIHRLVRSGDIRAAKLHPAKNGAMLYFKEDIDQYINSKIIQRETEKE